MLDYLLFGIILIIAIIFAIASIGSLEKRLARQREQRKVRDERWWEFRYEIMKHAYQRIGHKPGISNPALERFKQQEVDDALEHYTSTGDNRYKDWADLLKRANIYEYKTFAKDNALDHYVRGISKEGAIKVIELKYPKKKLRVKRPQR